MVRVRPPFDDTGWFVAAMLHVAAKLGAYCAMTAPGRLDGLATSIRCCVRLSLHHAHRDELPEGDSSESSPPTPCGKDSSALLVIRRCLWQSSAVRDNGELAGSDGDLAAATALVTIRASDVVNGRRLSRVRQGRSQCRCPKWMRVIRQQDQAAL